jgi:hypothetical protein
MCAARLEPSEQVVQPTNAYGYKSNDLSISERLCFKLYMQNRHENGASNEISKTMRKMKKIISDPVLILFQRLQHWFILYVLLGSLLIGAK